jgi:hypothetical protein
VSATSRDRGINKRSLESEDPRRILQGSTTHACTIRLSKSWTRDLREFGFFGPNRELTNFDCNLSMRKVAISGGPEKASCDSLSSLWRRVGPCSRPAGLRVQTLPAARRYDSRGILRCQPLLDAHPHPWVESHRSG